MKRKGAMSLTKCWVCGMPRKLINSHPVYCSFCKKEHDVCPTCHPDLVKSKIISLPAQIGRWPNVAFRTTVDYESSCLSKEMLSAARLME